MIYAFILNILSSKKFWIILGIIVLIVVIYFVLRKNWHLIQNSTQRRYIQSYVDPNTGETIKVGSDDRKYLEKIAQDLYDSIYGTHSDKAYDDALLLRDDELLYVSKFYKNALTRGTSLFVDIDDEFFTTWNQRDVKIMRRLSAIGEGEA